MEFLGQHVEHAEVHGQGLHRPLGERDVSGLLHGVQHGLVNGKLRFIDREFPEIPLLRPADGALEFFYV